MAFLGKDSIKGSRAAYAVKEIEPKAYLTFQHNLFMKQPNNENVWITDGLIDKEISNLHISEESKNAIKKNIKPKTVNLGGKQIKIRKLLRRTI